MLCVVSMTKKILRNALYKLRAASERQQLLWRPDRINDNDFF